MREEKDQMSDTQFKISSTNIEFISDMSEIKQLKQRNSQKAK
jgi:hypothetical protein